MTSIGGTDDRFPSSPACATSRARLRIAGSSQRAADWGPPSLSFSSGVSGLNDVVASRLQTQNIGVSAAESGSFGPWQVRAGFSFTRRQRNQLGLINPRGSFGFTGAATGIDVLPVFGSSMVVRASYGIYADTGAYEPIASSLAAQPPCGRNFAIRGTAAAALTMATALTAPGDALGTFAVDQVSARICAELATLCRA
ncbi:MAG: hypothetical protein IPP47_21510 [Bryobacterales bacterium]|nr:hypothetical protein [Bryobacterales bacterium]